MADYATEAQLTAYLSPDLAAPATGAATERVLTQAERDIDSILGSYTLEGNGLKFGRPQGVNEKGLAPGQVIALQRATLAQAEYRIEMGESFFIRDQHQSVSGPDFSRTGALAYIGPKVIRELDGGQLVLGKADIGMLAIIAETAANDTGV